jgi:hypothetical protein
MQCPLTTVATTHAAQITGSLYTNVGCGVTGAGDGLLVTGAAEGAVVVGQGVDSTGEGVGEGPRSNPVTASISWPCTRSCCCSTAPRTHLQNSDVFMITAVFFVLRVCLLD